MKKDIQNVIITFSLIGLMLYSGSFFYTKKVNAEDVAEQILAEKEAKAQQEEEMRQLQLERFNAEEERSLATIKLQEEFAKLEEEARIQAEVEAQAQADAQASATKQTALEMQQAAERKRIAAEALAKRQADLAAQQKADQAAAQLKADQAAADAKAQKIADQKAADAKAAAAAKKSRKSRAS